MEECQGVFETGRGGTYKPDSVCIWMKIDVSNKRHARYPSRDEMERPECDAEEGNYVLVRQTFPLDDVAVNCLVGLSTVWVEKGDNLCK